MMILHHYEMSPFSEKVRLMFGYAGLQWQSLLSPEMPPRPALDPIVGGYRRIPVAQVGADLFCDTRLISEEVAALAGRPELSPLSADSDTRAFLDDLESRIFWASVLSIPMGVTLRQLVRSLGWRGTLRFIKDRAGVGRHARMDIPSPKQAAQQFREHLEGLEQRLEGDFLYSDSPELADFCAYHTLWFKREVGGLPLPGGLPAVDAWYQRMTRFGHGERREISTAEAVSAARDNAPRPIAIEDTSDPRIGSAVSIRPTDYALDAVEGILVACSKRRYIVAREADTAGTVHVHFPRSGFAVSPLDGARQQ